MTRHRSVLEELRPPGGWWAPTEPPPSQPAEPPDPKPVDTEDRPAPRLRSSTSPSRPAAAGAGRQPSGSWWPRRTPSGWQRPLSRAEVDAEARLAREREATTGWMRQAACVGLDVDLFFPERGEPTAEAKAVCAGCPVRADCLEHALEAGEKHGVWGGKSERERRRIRRQRAAARAEGQVA